jgi:hypothetical protein
LAGERTANVTAAYGPAAYGAAAYGAAAPAVFHRDLAVLGAIYALIVLGWVILDRRVRA